MLPDKKASFGAVGLCHRIRASAPAVGSRLVGTTAPARLTAIRPFR